MSPAEHAKWIKTATLKELVGSVICGAVLEGTSHCGWTDRARDGLVESITESVFWAIDQKADPSPNYFGPDIDGDAEVHFK